MEKVIPVTIGFDVNKVIGKMIVEESLLPPLLNYHFGLRVIKRGDKFDVVEVSLIDDSQFKSWNDMIKEEERRPMVRLIPGIDVNDR